MDFKEFILNEMRVHRSPDLPEEHDFFVIAFRGDIWLLDQDDDAYASMILNQILNSLPEDKRNIIKSPYIPTTDVYDIMNWISESINDSFTGRFLHKKKMLLGFGDELPSPISSSLMKKVMKELGAKTYSFDNSQLINTPHGPDDIYQNYNYKKKDFLGDISDTMYHGTCIKYLPDILNLGLYPGKSDTNFAFPHMKIQHDDKIFLTNNKSKAHFHANHCASVKNSYPAVIQVKVPDKNLLIPDYDAEREATGGKGATYAHIHNKSSFAPSSVYSVTPFKASKHFGSFGYKGRIPASQIEAVYMLTNRKIPGQNRRSWDWRKVNLNTLKNRIKSDPWEWESKYGFF
jgi:hypothetical protein